MRKLLWALCAVALLQSCGGGSGPGADPPDSGHVDACTVDAQRASLDAWMSGQYYWYHGLSIADTAAPDMATYFDSKLAKPQDRYSFSQSTESFNQVFTDGTRYGWGYALVWDAAARALRVRNVEPASPVAAAGLHRGDIVESIDGFSAMEVLSGAAPGVDVAGVPRHFVVRNADGTTRDLAVNSARFALTPIVSVKTLDATRDGQPVKVGYLAYTQFVTYSVWGLGLATQSLADAGVSEMVIDLRYNGGGAVVVSRDLASMVTGALTNGAVYSRLQFNDQHPEEAQELLYMLNVQRFSRPIEGLKRVFVITSRGTASASELLINGLKPYVQVVLVGDTTYGKPYGFVPRSNCGTTYNAVNFEAFNAQGKGGYSDGIPADCYVPDDLDHELGDPHEKQLAQALGYIATGRCSAQSPQSASLTATTATTATPARVVGETVPEQMFVDR